MLGYVISFIVFLLFSGCAAQPAPQIITAAKVVDTACSWSKPILVSKQDSLTDGTAKQILAHNLTGAKQCDWKP